MSNEGKQEQIEYLEMRAKKFKEKILVMEFNIQIDKNQVKMLKENLLRIEKGIKELK